MQLALSKNNLRERKRLAMAGCRNEGKQLNRHQFSLWRCHNRFSKIAKHVQF